MAEEKRARIDGSMPAPMRAKIEDALDALPDVEFNRRSHHSRGPLTGAAIIVETHDWIVDGPMKGRIGVHGRAEGNLSERGRERAR